MEVEVEDGLPFPCAADGGEHHGALGVIVEGR